MGPCSGGVPGPDDESDDGDSLRMLTVQRRKDLARPLLKKLPRPKYARVEEARGVQEGSTSINASTRRVRGKDMHTMRRCHLRKSKQPAYHV